METASSSSTFGKFRSRYIVANNNRKTRLYRPRRRNSIYVPTGSANSPRPLVGCCGKRSTEEEITKLVESLACVSATEEEPSKRGDKVEVAQRDDNDKDDTSLFSSSLCPNEVDSVGWRIKKKKDDDDVPVDSLGWKLKHIRESRGTSNHPPASLLTQGQGNHQHRCPTFSEQPTTTAAALRAWTFGTLGERQKRDSVGESRLSLEDLSLESLNSTLEARLQDWTWRTHSYGNESRECDDELRLPSGSSTHNGERREEQNCKKEAARISGSASNTQSHVKPTGQVNKEAVNPVPDQPANPFLFTLLTKHENDCMELRRGKHNIGRKTVEKEYNEDSAVQGESVLLHPFLHVTVPNRPVSVDVVLEKSGNHSSPKEDGAPVGTTLSDSIVKHKPRPRNEGMAKGTSLLSSPAKMHH